MKLAEKTAQQTGQGEPSRDAMRCYATRRETTTAGFLVWWLILPFRSPHFSDVVFRPSFRQKKKSKCNRTKS